MKWNNKFNYPKSTRSIEDGYRKYFLGEEIKNAKTKMER